MLEITVFFQVGRPNFLLKNQNSCISRLGINNNLAQEYVGA